MDGKKVVRQEYSKDNLGIYYWEKEMEYLHQVADEIEEYFRNGEMDRVMEILDSRKVKYEIVDKDRMVLYDNLLSHRGSEGYCEVVLIRVDEKTETQRLRELSKRYITGKYRIVVLDIIRDRFAIGSTFRDYEEGDVISGEELRRLIDYFCLYIEDVADYSGDPAFLYGYESFRCGGNGFGYSISERDVILHAHFTTEYGEFSEYIHLRKISD